METKSSVPRAILVGIQVPSVDDVSHAASPAGSLRGKTPRETAKVRP